MNALIFIVDQLFALALLVVLLRLVLQISRADFRNPIAQAIVRLTNPLILPLRRILPPVGKIDTASVVAVVLIAIAQATVVLALSGMPHLSIGTVLYVAMLEIARKILWTYFVAIFAYALLSMIAPGGYSPAQSLLAAVCEPVLKPFRIIPPISGIDLSPVWACIAIQALLILLP